MYKVRAFQDCYIVVNGPYTKNGVEREYYYRGGYWYSDYTKAHKYTTKQSAKNCVKRLYDKLNRYSNEDIPF